MLDPFRAATMLAAMGVASLTLGGDAPWEIVVDVGAAGGGNVEIAGTSTDDRLDSGFVFGVSGIRFFKPTKAFEFSWLHQRGTFDERGAGIDARSFDLDLDAIDFAGTYSPVRDGHRPFVSASLGLLWVSPDVAGFDDDLTASLSLAGGTTFSLSPRVGLRLLARGRFVLEHVSFAGLCGAGACTIEIFASGPFRLEGTAGLVIRL